MRIVYTAIAVLVLIVAPATTSMDSAQAGGFIDDLLPRVSRFYFHGEGEAPPRLNNRHLKLTIKYDGETICSDSYIDDTSVFGGYTTGKDRKVYGNVYVKFVFYEWDGRFIREDSWTKKFDGTSLGFSHYDSTWHWGFALRLERGQMRNGIQHVAVKFG